MTGSQPAIHPQYEMDFKKSNWRDLFAEEIADALERVEANVDEEWMLFAMAALCRTARKQKRLTADHVALTMEEIPDQPHTHEKRAMGAVMKRGQLRGWISPTEEYDRCKRENQHQCPKRVWESRIYRGQR